MTPLLMLPQVACSLFMLLAMLRHYDVDGRHRLAARCSRAHIDDVARLRANVGLVEISRHGRLERIFFQIPAVCRFLTDQARAGILAVAAYSDNHQDKMNSFVGQVQVRPSACGTSGQP